MVTSLKYVGGKGSSLLASMLNSGSRTGFPGGIQGGFHPRLSRDVNSSNPGEPAETRLLKPDARALIKFKCSVTWLSSQSQMFPHVPTYFFE